MTWVWVPSSEWSTGTSSHQWDYGVTWRAYRSVNPTDLVCSPDDVFAALRDPNDGAESNLIQGYIAAATQACEDDTERALMPQTWVMQLSGFPVSGEIHLPRPPFIEVTSLAYRDASDEEAELAVSPAEFQVTTRGSEAKAIVRPVSGESFPSTSTRPDAVSITFRCGFSDEEDQMFQMLRAGIVRMATEMSQVRGLSVQGTISNAAVLDARRFWKRWRVA